MSPLKRVARLVAGALLVTGVFASSAAPASATPDHALTGHAQMRLTDTGWGG
jgi:hypothetical protein